MKKRLMALLLVLLICLTACDENRRPDPEDEATSFEEITPSKYIEIANKDYKGFDLYLNIYDYTEAELEQEILELLNERKPAEVYTNDDPNYIPKITAGDTVSIYYRGYVLNEDGTRDYQSGMTNTGVYDMSRLSPFELTIGKGEFITGFESGMAGKSLADFPTLELITEGAVTDGLIVYVSSTLRVDGKITASMECTPFRIPEDKEYLDEYYGEGLYETIISLEIGGDSATISGVTQDGGTYAYEDIRIEYACAPYDEETYEPLYMRFPIGYGHGDLEGKEIWLEVYVENITEYYNDEAGQGVFDDGFAERLLADDAALKSQLDLLYPSLSPAEQIRRSIKDQITKEYARDYDMAFEDAIIEHYVEKANIKKWPRTIRTNLQNQFIDAFKEDYQEFLYSYSKFYNETNFPITSFARDFGPHYGITNPDDWEGDLKAAADRVIKINLIIRYIIQTEGLDVSENALRAEMDKVIEESYDIYKRYFFQTEGKSEDDYKDNEEGLRADVYAFAHEHDEEGITSTAYYNIAMTKIKADFGIRTHTLDE